VNAVNLALDRAYSNPERAKRLGEQLTNYKGQGYVLLKKEPDLSYQHNEEFRQLLFERLHRDALEQAARTIQADHTRRGLMRSALSLLNTSATDQLRLLKNRYIPADLIRRVRDSCEGVRNNGTGYHYALGVLRQLRKTLDEHILSSVPEPLGSRSAQRRRVADRLQTSSPKYGQVIQLVSVQIQLWNTQGYPFTVPQLRKQSLDYSASTENSVTQGYWFALDEQKENEVLLYIKLPPGIDGMCTDGSPYANRTLTFRFLDWLPRAALKARKAAETAKEQGKTARAAQLAFRAAKLEDQHQQLKNTVQLQHVVYGLSRLKQKRDCNSEEVARLEADLKSLKSSRRSAPARLLMRGHRVTLQIPFLPPDRETLLRALGDRKYTALAGVDRGIRVPVTLSVQQDDYYVDELFRVERLLAKREILREHASSLRSEVGRKRNNWEKKRPGLSHPPSLLKKERHQDAVWQKVCRLDREVSRLVASRTVWSCEQYNVKTVYFEDLKNYRPFAGHGDLSWRLSSNLWGKIIETVRYMRESLGHNQYSVWTVNPRGTSRKCHACGREGIRVECMNSEVERKGGEYFYCAHCRSHIHADVNAARNIIQVQTSSAVPGRASKDLCPSLYS
jgi:hypothetical protein